MNAKYLIAILAMSTAASAAFADAVPQSELSAGTMQAAPALTRADVEAGVADAASKGQLLTNASQYPADPVGASSITRDQVKAQLAQAISRGESYYAWPGTSHIASSR